MQITKAMHVTLDTSGTIPRLRFRNRETYMSTKTAEYDDQVTHPFTSTGLYFALARPSSGTCVLLCASAFLHAGP